MNLKSLRMPLSETEGELPNPLRGFRTSSIMEPRWLASIMKHRFAYLACPLPSAATRVERIDNRSKAPTLNLS
jgi:hypothetical protein